MDSNDTLFLFSAPGADEIVFQEEDDHPCGGHNRQATMAEAIEMRLKALAAKYGHYLSIDYHVILLENRDNDGIKVADIDLLVFACDLARAINRHTSKPGGLNVWGGLATHIEIHTLDGERGGQPLTSIELVL